MRIKADEIVVIAGQRGSGKTVLAEYLARKFVRAGHRVIFMDPHRELNLPDVRMIYEADPDRQEKVLYAVWKMWNVVLFIDEAQNLFRASPHPLKGIKAQLVNQGRHRKIGMVFISPRIQQLHNDVLAQARTMFLFHMMLPRDMEHLEPFIGPIAWRLRRLPPYHFIVFRDGRAFVHKPIPLPSRRKKVKRVKKRWRKR